MNTLYSFALSFTVCSFAVLIINYLFPNGNVKKTASLVLSLYVLVSVITPLKALNKIELSISEKKEDEEVILNGTASAVKSRLRMLTDKVLKEQGIDNYELKIDVSMDENDIVIERFTVLLEDITDSDTIKNEIREKTGIEPEIDKF